jgi:hypothetical protein
MDRKRAEAIFSIIERAAAGDQGANEELYEFFGLLHAEGNNDGGRMLGHYLVLNTPEEFYANVLCTLLANARGDHAAKAWVEGLIWEVQSRLPTTVQRLVGVGLPWQGA